jgi:hypothetical protein
MDIVDIASMESAHRSQVEDRQFRSNGAKMKLILKHAQHDVLHQMLWVGPSIGGNLRNPRFLLGSEVHFHRFQDTKENCL